MQVTQYTFQTPYPNQLQIGRPDTATQQQERQQAETQRLDEANNTSMQNAKEYELKLQSSIKEKVSTTATAETSGAVNSFSALNAKVQASEAYGA